MHLLRYANLILQTAALRGDFWRSSVKRHLSGRALQSLLVWQSRMPSGGSLFHTEGCKQHQPCSMERVEDVCVAATCAFVGSHLMTQWMLEAD